MTESSFSSLMWVQSLQICTVFAMAWLTSGLLRNRSPHIAHVLWLVVLLKCVTPPLWSSSTGVFCWLQNVGTSEAKVTSVVVAPIVKHTANETVLLKPTPAETQHLPDLKPLPSHDAVPQPVSIPETRSKLGWSTWLLFAWAVGVAIASVILGVQIVRCLMLCRNGNRDPQLQQAVDVLAQKIGLRRRVRVLVTASNVGPAVIGIFRPKIILPEVITKSRSIESLHPVLMHELIHIRRGDLWLGCLQTFARLFWWFHPLVHWSVRQASRSAESCCDRESLAALQCSPREYAQCLLTILEQKKQLTPIPSFPGVRAVDITSNRLEQIMKTRQGSLRTGKRWSICVLLASALVVLPGAAFVAAGDEYAETIQPASFSKFTTTLPEEGTPGLVPRITVVDSYEVHDVLLAFAVSVSADLERARRLFPKYLAGFCATEGTREIPDLQWSRGGEDLLVGGPQECHVVIQKELERCRQFGIQPMTLRVSICEIPRDRIQSLAAVLTPIEIKSVDSRWPLLVNENEPEDQLWPEINEAYARFHIHHPKVGVGGIISRQLRDQLVHGDRQDLIKTFYLKDSYCQAWDRQDLKAGTPVTTSSLLIVPEGEQQASRDLVVGRVLRARPIVRGKQITLECQYQASESPASFRSSDLSKKIAAGMPPPDIHLTRMSCKAQVKLGQTLVLAGFDPESTSNSDVIPVVLLSPEFNGEPVRPAVQPQRRHLSAKAYPVADLVIPNPEFQPIPVPPYSIAASERNDSVLPTDGDPVFEELIDLITTTVRPGSWGKAGGSGAISTNPNTLSLVIRQESKIHDVIVELFQQLRRLRRGSTVLRVDVIRLPKAVCDSLPISSLTSARKLLTVNPGLQGQEQADWDAIVSRQPAGKRFNVRTTLMNGRSVPLAFSEGESLQIVPVISQDRRYVRISIAPPGKESAVTFTVRDQASIRFDITDHLTLTDELAIDEGERIVISITPRIHIVEEEEEVVLPDTKSD